MGTRGKRVKQLSELQTLLLRLNSRQGRFLQPPVEVPGTLTPGQGFSSRGPAGHVPTAPLSSGPPFAQPVKTDHGQCKALSLEAALGYSLEWVASSFSRAAFIENFKECQGPTLYLPQEAAMLLLAISLVCTDAPPHLVVALSGLTMAMGPGTQPGTDPENKNYVDLPRHISGWGKGREKGKRQSQHQHFRMSE